MPNNNKAAVVLLLPYISLPQHPSNRVYVRIDILPASFWFPL